MLNIGLNSTKISVVVPVFNAGSYIEGCLNSIFSQINHIHEVVLVDDHSTDDHTINILKSYSSHPKFTIVFNNINVGVCECQNIGIGHSTGEYIAFVDCDDMLLPGALSAVLAAIAEANYDYIFTNRIHINEVNQIIGTFRSEENINDFHNIHDSLLDAMFASHFKVIKSTALARAGGFVQGTEGIQDWDVALKISEFGRFCFIPEFLYAHRLHGNQTTAKHQATLFIKTNEVRRQALERRDLIYKGEVCNLSLAQVRNVIRQIRFSRNNHGAMFIDKIKVGIALAWVDRRLCIYQIDALLSIGFHKKADWLIIYGIKWHDIGYLRKMFVFEMPPVIFVVDEQSQDSVAMARWFSSYFYGIAFMSEAAELAVSGYIGERVAII